MHGRLEIIDPVRLSASATDGAGFGDTFEVPLIAAPAVGTVPGGPNPTFIENEIPTAATVHADLPAILMGLGKGIHQLPLGIKKILDLQHIVKLALNLRG